MSLNRIVLLSFSLALLSNHTLVCQSINKAELNTEIGSEWFLATGDWHRDPKLYVRAIGTGKDTVVLLHGGWGGEHRSLVASTRGLEDAYTFILYDQRGSLRSPFPDSIITFANHIEDLELIRRELHLDKMRIVGHSMGAVLASAYHNKYPSHVRSLTLLAPAPLKNPFPVEDTVLAKTSSAKLRTFLERPAVKAELNRLNLLRENPSLSSREETHKFRIYFAARFLYDIKHWNNIGAGGPFYSPKANELTWRSSPSSWDYPADFQNSKVPVTVIIGDHDFLDMDGAIIRKWMKGISSVQVKVIENAGHEIWVDQPEKFRASLATALQR